MSPKHPPLRWSLPLLSLLALLAVVVATSPGVQASGPVFDSILSDDGMGGVHCVTTLVSGPEGTYRHVVLAQVATGATLTLTEDRAYLVGHAVQSDFQVGGPVTSFIKETFDPLF